MKKYEVEVRKITGEKCLLTVEGISMVDALNRFERAFPAHCVIRCTSLYDPDWLKNAR